MQINQSFTDEDVILTDICCKSNKKINYTKFQDELDSIKIEANNIVSWSYSQYLHSLVKDIFLPKGYPLSVSSDYLEYQIWDTCQAFCSSICGTLTVQAVMESIGVGSKVATPVSAAITWVMKDGTGMLGSILFAWSKGSKLDSDCKKWRLFADILNDVAMFIELLIPKIIDYSMYMLCLATALKALVGTAGSSTRAALITHQAIRGNIADVSAKDGSQELFTNLIAFVFGIFLLKNVTETNQVWSVMYTATLFHLFFNYKAVKCLRMNVFNGERLRLSLRTYLPTSSIPTIEQVNGRESVFLGIGTTDYEYCGFSIIFGSSINKAIESQKITHHQLSALLTIFQDKKYFILVELKKKILYVTFRMEFSENDVLKAYFHAYLIGAAISFLQAKTNLQIINRSRKNSPIFRLVNLIEASPIKIPIEITEDENYQNHHEDVIFKAYSSCEDFIEKEFAAFCHACIEEGWDINKHLIIIGDWRAEWKYVPMQEKSEQSVKKQTVKHNSQRKSDKSKKFKASMDYSNLIIA